MKQALTILALSVPAISFGQGMSDTPATAAPVVTESSTMVHKLKSNDQVLPRWAIDLNYRTGWMTQEMTMFNQKVAFSPNNLNTSRFSEPVFTNGRSNSGELQLNYFFNKRRTLGVSIGGTYNRYTGDVKMDTLYADYQSADSKDRIYRQIIRSNAPLQEAVKISNINIPLLLQFKHQFGRPEKPSNFGITAAVGPVFGLYNETQGTASGNFSYEAIYKLNDAKTAVVSGFDGTIPSGDPSTSWIITEKNYMTGGEAGKTIDDIYNQNAGFNVGVNKTLAPSQRVQKSSYSEIAYGGMVQLGVSYSLTYNVAFNLGGYAMWQRWQNTGNENYRFTEHVVSEAGNSYGSYKPLTGAVKQSDYISYGVSAGFRIFFGEKRDVDGDKVPDAIDKCKLEYGEARFNGCPDTDGDGIVDDQDACKFEKGPEYTNGCPDRDEDGVADKVDRCPDEYGELRNGCPVSVATRDAPVDTTLIAENGTIMAPHIVLETDALFFDLGKSVIKDSAASILDYAAKVLETNDKVVIHITGYTDDIGTYQNNLVLSYERGRAARTYLISKGISEKRIIISGYGTENPARPNTNEENRAKNRRIEFKLLLPL
jgi:outer membrane protein OmpA-like peptidoglycan-associated protein